MIDHYLLPIGVSIFLFFGGWILARITKRIILRLSERTPDQGILTFLASFLSISIRVLSIIMILDQLGVNSNVIVGAFSACALGVSMALKSNMADVAGGIQVLLTKPFVLGDYIALGSYEGTVLKIDLMFTIIQTVDHQEVVIPNSKAVNDILVNYSKETVRRIHITIPISVKNDVSYVKDLFLTLMKEHPGLLSDQPMDVIIDSFEGTTMVVGLYAYCLCADYWPVRNALYESVHKKRISEEIEIPYQSIKLGEVS